MSDVTVFILAKGIIEGKTLKELSFEGRKTLIRYTQDKFNTKCAVYVVTSIDEIAAESCDVIRNDNKADCSFKSLFETVENYSKELRQNIIIFGHKFIDDNLRDKIIKFRGELKVFGEISDIKAISYLKSEETKKTILNLLNND